MASSGNVFCKLPLLDGEGKLAPQTLAVDAVSGNVNKNLLELCKQDGAAFNNILFTAWSLLLRCYTGQDSVSFRVESSAISANQQSLFQLEVQRQESLLTCLERARKVSTDNVIPKEQKINTTVLIRDANGLASSAVERSISDVRSKITRVSGR
ncbi:MAG: hypothetical protein L6R41_004597 [Letrouitia leprolyta]|nr:MAG: hypothetical protein L6R41_004597 [Letrouitia leprolyta]